MRRLLIVALVGMLATCTPARPKDEGPAPVAYAETLRATHALADQAAHQLEPQTRDRDKAQAEVGGAPTPTSEQRASAVRQEPPVPEPEPEEERLRAKGSAPSAPILEEALGAITRTFDLPGSGPNETITEARRDLALRAARLLLEARRPEEALGWVERGLALSATPTALRASLLMAGADAEEELGRPELARQKLFSALEINQALLNQELENP